MTARRSPPRSVTKTNGRTTMPKPRANPAPSLRLLKVIVQPVFVFDDGESLVEQIAEPLVVPAAEWPAFPARLAVEMGEMEKQLAARLNLGG